MSIFDNNIDSKYQIMTNIFVPKEHSKSSFKIAENNLSISQKLNTKGDMTFWNLENT